MDRQQQTDYINKKIAEFTEKAHLKKPNWKFDEKIALPAFTDPARNEIKISKSFSNQWKNGDFDEKDADALLAHEFGHLIDMKPGSKFVTPMLLGAYVILMAAIAIAVIVIALAIGFSTTTIVIFHVLAFCIIACLLCLPTILKKSFIPHELKADSNAIDPDFDLINAQQFADSIVKIELMPNKNNKKIGIMNKIEYWRETLKHPSLNKRLDNIGFEIKIPINTKRKGGAQQS